MKMTEEMMSYLIMQEEPHMYVSGEEGKDIFPCPIFCVSSFNFGCTIQGDQ